MSALSAASNEMAVEACYERSKGCEVIIVKGRTEIQMV